MSGEDMFQGMRYVYEVYREMSFSRAAKKLFISQPSLSNAVRKTNSGSARRSLTGARIRSVSPISGGNISARSN